MNMTTNTTTTSTNATIINGKEIALKLRNAMAEKIEKLKTEKNLSIGLAAVALEKDDASGSYLKNLEKVCTGVGVEYHLFELDKNITEEAMVAFIKELNSRADIHGIIVQVPLPKYIDEDKIAKAISIDKDVDCFNPENLGKLFRGEKCLLPCTPKGIIRLLESCNVDLAGKTATVIGRSNIVGKPAAILLLDKNTTVTICHSKTKDLKEQLLRSDIIVSAVGVPGIVSGDMVKEGAIVIDAGTRIVDGVLKGDVDFDTVSTKAAFITPVPGGVGAMTTTMLIENVLEASGYDE
jgi:methylenetetrahydrofolate dehydrogenase (NADP+) / methenyltetrahydrofolate cyclohydrolase